MAFLNHLKSLFAAKSKLDVRSRFELLREAISGTMSKVYMARDRSTGEVVALKILDRKKTADFEARFKGIKKPIEGQIAVQFDHPYIVKTHEHGLTTDNCQYLVMEFLAGGGMNSLLVARDNRLEGRRLRFIRQAAEALAEVHARGFIHRDVCPRNLLLIGDCETLKLTDFGLTVPATRPFMMPGNRTGTPNYMAPELVRRRATDQRLDVFAFGVTSYEIFTRELPWPKGTTGMAALGHDQPPAPIQKYLPDISPKLAEAIHACIQPDLGKRCPSMEHFLHILGRAEEEEGVP